MAISDAQKLDYLFKKIGYGLTKTDTNANKKAPNESIASPLLLRGDRVWKNSGSIPSVIPGSSSGVVTVYPTSAPVECTADGTATANRTWKTGSTDWIPTEIGATYGVKVYIHTSSNASNAASGGDQVFGVGSGNNDEWFFDYQSGVLHFIGDNLPNGIDFTGKSVYISGARYTGSFGVGGGAANNFNQVFTGNTTITTLILSTVLGVEQGGTGVSSLTKDGVLFGANTTTMGFATGANGNILQIAANGTPTFGVNILDGGDF